MTTRRSTQQYGYIAVLLLLAFACAIPLIHAHSVQDDWSGEHDTSGWAWVGGHSISVQNGNVKARSEHQCGILNNNHHDISVTVGYDNKLLENGTVVDDDIYSGPLTVPPDTYLTTSDVDANYVRSASTTHDSNDSYKFQPYTKIVYKGQAQARAMHLEIDL